MEFIKVYKVVSYERKPWLKMYTDENSKSRVRTKTDIEKLLKTNLRNWNHTFRGLSNKMVDYHRRILCRPDLVKKFTLRSSCFLIFPLLFFCIFGLKTSKLRRKTDF